MWHLGQGFSWSGLSPAGTGIPSPGSVSGPATTLQCAHFLGGGEDDDGIGVGAGSAVDDDDDDGSGCCGCACGSARGN